MNASPHLPRPPSHSPEMLAVLSETPSWLLRWGLTAAFAVVLLLLSAAWSFRYPERLEARFTLVTMPTEIEPGATHTQSGSLPRLLQDGQEVQPRVLVAAIDIDNETAVARNHLVRQGQSVILIPDRSPLSEQRVIQGHVVALDITTRDCLRCIIVALASNDTTEALRLVPGIEGTAQIAISEMRLLKRLIPALRALS